MCKNKYSFKEIILYPFSIIMQILKKIFDVLLNPVFFLSTILIAFVINSFFTVSPENLPKGIGFLVENRVYSISIIIGWGLFCLMKNKLDLQNEAFKQLQVEVENKNRQIQVNSGLIEAKYGEFANSIKIRNIKEILDRAIKRFPILEASHLYSYEYQRIDNDICIKLQFWCGCEQERTCINVIKQNYYTLEKNIFYSLRKVNNLNDTLTESKIIGEISKAYDQIEQSKAHESIKYLLSQVLFTILCEKLKKKNVGIQKGPDSPDIDSFRTGILGSVLLERGYIYKYNRNKKLKQGRVYFSTPIVFDSEYILNICIDGRGLEGEALASMFNDIVIFIKDEYTKIIGGGNNEKTR